MSRQPNVIVCLCDQLRAFEVGCYGNAVVRTPNIDRLARDGVRFEYAVTNNPVCMPARSSLLSGEYSRTCMGSLGNYAERDALGNVYLPEYPVEQRTHFPNPTLPEQFKSLGYETVLFGKWHIQPTPGLVGFDYALFPRVHHRHTGQTFIENSGPGQVVDGYSIDFEAEQVAAYLRQRRDSERPFFMYYNISPPHMPLVDAPDKYLAMYSPDEVPLRPNVFRDGQPAYDEHWFKIYLWDFLYYQERLSYTQRLPDGFDLRHLIALYYGMTTWVDDTVGRLMAELAENGLQENTIIVFLSDHGDNLGSHHTFNKDTLKEESIRIPFIFHGPGRWLPQVNSAQVAQIIDVMPTLLDVCGADIPPDVQGRSLRPFLEGQAGVIGNGAVFIETSSGQIGIRTPTHLYGMQLSPDLRTISNDCLCFYDLRADPYEFNNLATAAEQVPLAAEMRNRLAEWNRSTPWLTTPPSPPGRGLG
jgi:choline-sulfatase